MTVAWCSPICWLVYCCEGGGEGGALFLVVLYLCPCCFAAFTMTQSVVSCRHQFSSARAGGVAIVGGAAPRTAEKKQNAAPATATGARRPAAARCRQALTSLA